MRPLSDPVPNLPHVPFIHSGSQPLSPELHGSVMLLGNFDGLHQGHAELVRRAAAIATARGAPLAILQCDPHPRAYFSAGARFRVSTGLAQVHLLAAAGVQLIFAPRFDEAFAAMSADDFVTGVLMDHLRIGGLVVGRDFRFGRQRLGDVSLLRQHSERHGFSLHVIDDQLADNRRVSTSSVRAAIVAGDIALATRLLGHEWLVQVYKDDNFGWQFAADQLLPPDGDWPVAALDRAGRHLGHAQVSIRNGNHLVADLPSRTALMKWLPTAVDTFVFQRQGRDAYA